MQLRQPRLAEMVAGILRDRIVRGELEDGALLPRQEDLLTEFNVSKPSLREALRILEAEGLINVRRGNQGGAVVHVPTADNAAYMIGLVLKFRSVPIADIAEAIKRIEPVCAGLCAAREDRGTEVLPALRRIHDDIVDNIDDAVAFTRLSRHFHEELVARCGNETLILIVGALERLWSAQEEAWAERAQAAGTFPERHYRESGVKAHKRIITLIESGDVERLHKHAREHLESSLRYTSRSAEERPLVILPRPHREG